MKNKSIGLLVGAVAVIGAGAWYLQPGAEGHTAQGQGKGAGNNPPTVVNVVTPQRQDVPVQLQASGTVTPVSAVDLHPQTTSTIRTVHIKEGQFVKKGELMFSLDDRSDVANEDKARAQVARDQAALADVERQYKRSADLFAQKFIAQSAVDTLKSQVDAARALLQADAAAVQASRVSVSYTSIRAPMSGRVGAINVYPGSLVQLATSLTTITQLDPITVAFTLPEAQLPALLDAQQHGGVAVDATTSDSSKTATGKLSFIDNTVDPQAGTIRVKAEFGNAATTLWPGEFVNTRLTVRTLKDAIVIPQTAIVSNTRGTFVYTFDADQTAHQVDIKRVHSFGLYAAVTGLAGNEKVITEGKQNLRPGAKVKLAEAAAAPRKGSAK